MHSNSYNVKVGCISSKNFINSLEEVKSFFGFKLVPIEDKSESSINNNCNAVIIETKSENKNLSNKITIPKIFIQDKHQKRVSKNPFELILRLPINIIQFNQSVIDLCKKHEFNKNSLIEIRDYVLDKKIRTRTTLSSSFNMICEKILLENNETFVAKYYQNKEKEFNSIISEKNSLSYLANITSLVPKIKFNSNELLIIDYIENNNIKDKNYQIVLAEEILKIHQNTNEKYGFKFDAQIGALKQINEFTNNWVIFFRDKRLNSIFELINNNNPMASHINQRIEKLLKNIHNLIPSNPIPRLLHGDLWAGNILYNSGKLVGLIDPGIFFGHNELEIAYLTWFNFVNEEFIKIYSNSIPIERDYFEYEPIYQLYYCLLNVHLWDRMYIRDVEKLLNKIKI